MTDAPVPTFPDGPYAGRTVAERDVEVARAMQFLQGVGYKITFPSLRQAEQLKAIDNGLRNGSRMTEANLAFDELCTALGVDRESWIEQDELVEHEHDKPDCFRKDVEMTFSPMLAVSAPATDATIKRLQGTHFFETKIDGVRAIVAINRGTVRITNRNGVDTTYRYPELVSAALQKFGTDAQLILDGEVTVLNSDGHPSFKLTSKRDRQQKRAIIEALSTSMPVTFIVFDLLYRASGPSMDRRSLPWQDRHAELLDVFNTTPANKHIRVNAGGTDGEQMMALVREYKLEGLVAKEVTSPYQSGRRSQWIKIKPTITGSFLVTGTTEGTGTRQATFGALSLAVVREDGSLLPVGEVGSGFKQADLTDVLDVLSSGADLIVEVEYMEYTVDGSLRFPVFRGIRSDVTRLDCSVDQLS